ncbi:hypothetical protein H2199_007754 [Coniosporium tulheliwenetii]|uniref:Uncharacterized protein n=1 Tax=Coniosporium tulheliwenetii TaxID=3383036 RepID=A0ACC2YN79_9PEZI|nr:hypothetical protein H2199_007754 [Cladosporium sp. JES 115]
MGPPTNPRKRKAPTLRAEDWEPYKARIIELHIEQNRPLPEVKDTIEREFGFQAEARQYRTRISQWRKDKNVKTHEMEAIVRKQQQRRLVEREKGRLAFTVRGKEVKPQKIDRYMKRKEIPEGVVYAPSPAASSTYIEQGRWTKAEELGLQVVETTKRVLGDEHPDTLSSIANLASTYMEQGRRKEAEELRLQVVETTKRVLGDEHPDTLISIANLASTYREQGRWTEAEELYIQVMETRKRVLGKEHHRTLNVMSNLAWTWKFQGRDQQAVGLMAECWQLRQRILGVDHPHTVSSLEALNDWQAEQTVSSSWTPCIRF